MYACGLRVGEATTLEVTAVDRARRVLRIVGKGDKERLVPLPQPVLDDLGRVWLTQRRSRFGPDDLAPPFWLAMATPNALVRTPIAGPLFGHARPQRRIDPAPVVGA